MVAPKEVSAILAEAAKARTTQPAQLRWLENRVAMSRAATRLAVLESFQIEFGGNAVNTAFNTEDPRWDDSCEPWNEVGIAGRVPRNRSRPRTLQEYDYARDIGRALDTQNLYAKGARKTRQDYIVGVGSTAKAVAKDQENENESLTERVNDALDEFRDANQWLLRELDVVHRSDRDGEAFLRLFMQGAAPLKIRWIEPEHVRPDPGQQQRAPFGVEVSSADSEKVQAYWVAAKENLNPRRVSADQPATDHVGTIPRICHLKANVDQSWPRGWPALWAARGALIRSEKVKKNVSTTVAIQTAIALIRKHDANASDVQSFLDDTDDMKTTNTLTGKDLNHQAVPAGTVIDSGPGIEYQAPISSIDVSRNMPAIDTELCSVAASLNMPAFMLSGKVDAAFAASLIGETPAIKHFLREQAVFGLYFEKILWAAVQHEVFWRRLPANVLEDYRLEVPLPDPQIRQPLVMAQTRQIQHAAGVLSTRTWQEQAGLDPETEKRNGAEAKAEVVGDKPPPGDPETTDGPGGSDMKGNDDPNTSPSNVAFSPEEGRSYSVGSDTLAVLDSLPKPPDDEYGDRDALLESMLVGGAHMDVLALMLKQVARLGIKLSAEDILKLQIVGTLQNEGIPASLRIQAVLRAMLGGEPVPCDDDTGGEVIPGTNT